MLSKIEVKDIQTLYQKTNRDLQQQFIVEGVKMVDEVLKSNLVVNKIYATKKWAEENSLMSNVTVVTDHDLERISNLTAPNQVLAVVQMPNPEENRLNNGIILLLDGIQDPGNFGTIIRTADWFGIEYIVCNHGTVDQYNSKVLQATMGSFLRVNISYIEVESYLQNNTLPIYGALLNGQNINEITIPKQCILVIGNEGKGISKNILSYITHPITIPKIGSAESLNAAVATGILLAKFCV